MTVNIKGMSKKRLAGAYVSSALSVTFVLVLVGLSSLLLLNANKVSDYLKESLKLSVILRQEVTDEQGMAYYEQLKTRSFVKEAEFIDKEQGARELKELLGEDFLNVFENDPVPVSVDVNLQSEYVCRDSLAVLKEMLEGDPLVDEVECQQNLVEELSTNMRKLWILLLVLTALMLFISLVLINNVVRLLLYNRRFSVYTMQLVGADRKYIRNPFLGKISLLGLAASLLAGLVLAAFLIFIKDTVPQLFGVFTPDVIAYTFLTVAGIGQLLCVGSAYLVVNRLLSMNKNELYG